MIIEPWVNVLLGCSDLRMTLLPQAIPQPLSLVTGKQNNHEPERQASHQFAAQGRKGRGGYQRDGRTRGKGSRRARAQFPVSSFSGQPQSHSPKTSPQNTLGAHPGQPKSYPRKHNPKDIPLRACKCAPAKTSSSSCEIDAGVPEIGVQVRQKNVSSEFWGELAFNV